MEFVLNGMKEPATIISFCLEGRQAGQPIRDGTGAVPYRGRDVPYGAEVVREGSESSGYSWRQSRWGP